MFIGNYLRKKILLNNNCPFKFKMLVSPKVSEGVLHALLRRWSLRRRRLSFLLDLVLSLLPDSNKIHFLYVLGFWVFQRR